ncbi:molybdopterin-synthase adenylyltransferase MoeB [Naumannella halotolerans]|uniref:Adenylyltransferase/sulfurtransferase n=1 Tax=Naumannella halotolerans TaxID=993414 RepID=A0A4R7JBA5_9ACTN|nr:molybdopterin-synthase adenylyltransferase MoeB [Naumannella halotolerans]TDT33709.1 adenylyltransferase/sulfurtransferase [Naumannella halotolerans]
MHPLVQPGPELTADELVRYDRQLLMPELGVEGQRRLKAARVLVVGAGGLGSPVLAYLAAAGVGTIGVIDADRVDTTNLHRQIIHSTQAVGTAKVDSAAARMAALNPLVTVIAHDEAFTATNAAAVVDGYDLVVDGTDNFAARYLVNDACVLAGKPAVWASILRSDGQVSVFWAGHGPCYRCVFPTPPAAGEIPSCAEGGVLGVLPGVIGTVQATEAMKLITGMGEPLLGRLLIHDALTQQWQTLPVAADPDCPICGEDARIGEVRAITGTTDAAQEAGISVRELRQLLAEREAGRQEFALVDLREPAEVAVSQIEGSITVPKSLLDSEEAALPAGRLVLYCRSGARSAAVLQRLRRAGRTDVEHLEGGILGWQHAAGTDRP